MDNSVIAKPVLRFIFECERVHVRVCARVSETHCADERFES
jgi:hypothetical protein